MSVFRVGGVGAICSVLVYFILLAVFIGVDVVHDTICHSLSLDMLSAAFFMDGNPLLCDLIWVSCS